MDYLINLPTFRNVTIAKKIILLPNELSIHILLLCNTIVMYFKIVTYHGTLTAVLSNWQYNWLFLSYNGLSDLVLITELVIGERRAELKMS